MGILRFILAISVMIHHGGRLGDITIVAADMAVILFYIMSGFYMAMILNEKYSKLDNGIKKFYLNRALRLYPAYLVCVILVLLFRYPPNLPYPFLTWTYLYGNPSFSIAALFQNFAMDLTNLTLIGQDFSRFLSDTFRQHAHWNPPAYTLSVEIAFYLMAPFIICGKHRIWKTLSILALGITFLIIIPILAPQNPSAENIFLPMLLFFMMGSIGYYLFRPLTLGKHQRLCKYIGATIFFFIVASLIFTLIKNHRIPFMYAPLQEDPGMQRLLPFNSLKAFALYIPFALSIPFLFIFSAKSKTDKFFGDLSYLIYISHWITLYHLMVPLQKLASSRIPPDAYGWIALTVASILYFAIDKPIEKLRASIAARSILQDQKTKKRPRIFSIV